MDFDLQIAKDTSEKNPYYYVAYAHARICSIFTKAKEVNLVSAKIEELEKFFLIDETQNNNFFFWSVERRNLLFQIARFVEEVHLAAQNLEPHLLVNYLYSLAQAFSQFYNIPENKIIKQNPTTATILLFILEKCAFCLRSGLELLCTEAPKNM